jgi:glutathione S-transferase
MQLFVARGACCLGAHVVVRELALPVEVVIVPLRTPGSPIHAVNPLGRVPALRFDAGAVLTENSAILPFLADQRPGTSLFAPAGTIERAQIQSWIGYLNSEVADVPLGDHGTGELALWVRNATDEQQPLNFIDFGPGFFSNYTLAYYQEPRTYGATLTYRW